MSGMRSFISMVSLPVSLSLLLSPRQLHLCCKASGYLRLEANDHILYTILHPFLLFASQSQSHILAIYHSDRFFQWTYTVPCNLPTTFCSSVTGTQLKMLGPCQTLIIILKCSLEPTVNATALTIILTSWFTA